MTTPLVNILPDSGQRFLHNGIDYKLGSLTSETLTEAQLVLMEVFGESSANALYTEEITNITPEVITPERVAWSPIIGNTTSAHYLKIQTGNSSASDATSLSLAGLGDGACFYPGIPTQIQVGVSGIAKQWAFVFTLSNYLDDSVVRSAFMCAQNIFGNLYGLADNYNAVCISDGHIFLVTSDYGPVPDYTFSTPHKGATLAVDGKPLTICVVAQPSSGGSFRASFYANGILLGAENIHADTSGTKEYLQFVFGGRRFAARDPSTFSGTGGSVSNVAFYNNLSADPVSDAGTVETEKRYTLYTKQDYAASSPTTWSKAVLSSIGSSGRPYLFQDGKGVRRILTSDGGVRYFEYPVKVSRYTIGTYQPHPSYADDRYAVVAIPSSGSLYAHINSSRFSQEAASGTFLTSSTSCLCGLTLVPYVLGGVTVASYYDADNFRMKITSKSYSEAGGLNPMAFEFAFQVIAPEGSSGTFKLASITPTSGSECMAILYNSAAKQVSIQLNGSTIISGISVSELFSISYKETLNLSSKSISARIYASDELVSSVTPISRPEGSDVVVLPKLGIGAKCQLYKYQFYTLPPAITGTVAAA